MANCAFIRGIFPGHSAAVHIGQCRSLTVKRKIYSLCRLKVADNNPCIIAQSTGIDKEWIIFRRQDFHRTIEQCFLVSTETEQALVKPVNGSF